MSEAATTARRAGALLALSACVLTACSGSIGDPNADPQVANEYGAGQGAEGSGDNGAPFAPAAAAFGDPTDPSIAGAAKAASKTDLVVAEIDRELANKRSATYSHTTFVDEAKGIYQYDCSGFVAYVLDRADPDAMAEVRAASVARPLARDFEGFFATLVAAVDSRWTKIDRAEDLRPGDVIAWLEPKELGSANTGHTMFAYGAPALNDVRSEVLVSVADATSSPHGASDARSVKHETGLGTGVVGLLVDAAGAPRGFYWAGGASAASHEIAVALARPR